MGAGEGGMGGSVISAKRDSESEVPSRWDVVVELCRGKRGKYNLFTCKGVP